MQLDRPQKIGVCYASSGSQLSFAHLESCFFIRPRSGRNTTLQTSHDHIILQSYLLFPAKLALFVLLSVCCSSARQHRVRVSAQLEKVVFDQSEDERKGRMHSQSVWRGGETTAVKMYTWHVHTAFSGSLILLLIVSLVRREY